MRSLQLTEFGQPLVWNEIATPEPQGTEVLLETVACGVCHSDLHLWEGFYDLGEGKRSYVKDRGVKLPMTLGHEVVGRVVAVGPHAEGVQVGDVRLLYPWIGCGECRLCAEESFHLCERPRSVGIFSNGGYSDHVLAPHPRFLVDIAGLGPDAACSYACAGLTAFSALRKLVPLEAEDDLVVIGAGGLGLMALQVVRELTSARVIVVDVDERKLEAASRFGDWTLVNARTDSAFGAIMELTGKRGVAAVVDFVGSAETARLGYGALAKNGTMVLVGLFGGQVTIPTPALPLKNLTIRGSYTGSLPELRELVRIVSSRSLPPLPLECFPMSQADRLLERMRSGDIVGRAVLQPESAALQPAAAQSLRQP